VSIAFMANMADAVWAKAAAPAARWLSVVALIVFNFARFAGLTSLRTPMKVATSPHP
jgi:hypothetical protein